MHFQKYYLSTFNLGYTAFGMDGVGSLAINRVYLQGAALKRVIFRFLLAILTRPEITRLNIIWVTQNEKRIFHDQ